MSGKNGKVGVTVTCSLARGRDIGSAVVRTAQGSTWRVTVRETLFKQRPAQQVIIGLHLVLYSPCFR